MKFSVLFLFFLSSLGFANPSVLEKKVTCFSDDNMWEMTVDGRVGQYVSDKTFQQKVNVPLTIPKDEALKSYSCGVTQTNLVIAAYNSTKNGKTIGRVMACPIADKGQCRWKIETETELRAGASQGRVVDLGPFRVTTGDGNFYDRPDWKGCIQWRRKFKEQTYSSQLGTECSPARKLAELKTQRETIVKQLPRTIVDGFAKYFPTIVITPFDAWGVNTTDGDFNCDGKTDYAAVGVKKSTELARTLASHSPSKTEIQKAFKQAENFRDEAPATVLIALSGKSGHRYIEKPGSGVGKKECGCCDSAKPAGKPGEKCDFLYIGCCGKDGAYLLFEKESTEERTIEGC